MGTEVVITTEFTMQDSSESLPTTGAPSDTPRITLKKPRRRQALMWISLGCVAVLLGIACLFARLASGHDYSRFEPSLLTITVTFAVFAVNFSFLEYQLSPYRALFRGIAWPHVASATMVLMLAIVPVGVALAHNSTGRVAAFILPIVAISSVVLALVARRCADPTQRIKSLLSEKQFEKFLVQLGTASAVELQMNEGLNLSSVHEAPSHEWDYRVPPKVDFFDPFDAAHTLAHAAATNGDGQVFDQTVEAIVKMVDITVNKKPLLLIGGAEADYKVLKLVANHARDRLIQLVRMTLEIDKTDRYAKGLGDILSAHLRVEAAASRQSTDFARGLMKSLSFLAVETYKRGWRTTAMRTLIVARECANKGISQPPKGEDIFFDHELVLYPMTMFQLADAALDRKDAEFLYRCMETLGYLGCSAVKADKRDLGRQCAQALVQISRRSRYLKLECFWTRCGMPPWQHARERLEWMLTWVARLPTGIQRAWLETFSEAYSRIDGKTLTIDLASEDDKPVFEFKRSDKPHTMTYMDKHTVTYDYSDESMLRDLQLY